MAATAIAMPKLGMTMEEGTVIDWPLSLGAPVEKGQLLLVIESEKSEVEIEAPASGVLRHVYVEPDQTVPCGTLLCAITETAEEPFDVEAFHAAENRPEASKSDGPSLEVKGVAEPQRAPAAEKTRKAIAPAARATARKLGIDPEQVHGTGPGGRVTKQDVEAHAAAREALVSVADGVALEVLVEGDGDPVVLLPGLGSDVSAFARQTEALIASFRVHGVNPRGVGLSDAPESDRTDVAQIAADAAAAIPDDAGPLHVVGASLGAAAALELALAQPERVRSLTLITPFIDASPRLLAVGDAWCRLAAEASPETLAAALLPWFFSEAFLSDEGRRRRSLRGLAQTVVRTPARTLERMFAGLQRWSGSRSHDLGRISAPTLVVMAGADLLTPGVGAIAAAIPGAKLHVVPEAGHAVALEAPESVNRALVAHLGPGSVD